MLLRFFNVAKATVKGYVGRHGYEIHTLIGDTVPVVCPLVRKVEDSARNDYGKGIPAAHTLFSGEKSGIHSPCKKSI